MKYFFHPEAEAEHLAEVAFYESRRKGLGGRYLASFGAAMERVCRDPKQFRIECEPDLRRIFLRGFPFAIIYRDVGRQIQVLAVAHRRRRPGYWATRI
ncbi:MAG: type II toxin-antitoxin system RelE/ParE family toxin [Burkholderiaceae bacterium]|nr:type II toxin-antitoxin system RelE/ParE family toxin [Burkholderiaceae bacterium]